MNQKNRKPAIRFKAFNDPWEQRKLGDESTEIIAGGDVDKISLLSKGQFPVIANALINDGIIGYYENKFRVKAPAVTVTGRGNIGHAKARETDFTPVVRLLSIKTKHNIYFLENAINTLHIVIESTGVPQLTAPQLSQYELMFPQKLEEEQRIGAFFRTLDIVITLHQRKLDKLQNVKKACLEKMFPQNGESVPRIRFKGFTDTWEQRKLSELASMHARIGWQNLRTSEFLTCGNYMLITGTDFVDGAINYSTCHFVEKERYEQDKNIQIKNGSILITKDGTLGKVAYVQGLSMPATLNAGVFNVRITDNSTVDGKYLFQYIKAPFLMDYVGKKATGGTIKHLNQNILVDFPIAMPKIAEQKKIGNFLQAYDNLITLHQRKLDKLKNLKKACLEKMFV